MKFIVRAVRPQTGERTSFIYDNETSALETVSGQAVVQPVPVHREASQLGLGITPGKTSPRVLKISLGLSCNYECEYCSQRFVPRADETNPSDVSAFLDGLDEWIKEPPEKIEFWGGEPLVYIKTLRPLAEAIRVRYPTAQLSMVTNGSLLTLDVNEWLDRMGFLIGLSHDGPGQHVRGPDPLQDPDKRAAILDLYQRLAPKKRISFNAMLTRENVSRAEVAKFFIDLTGDPAVPIGEGGFVDAYDQGGLAQSLDDAELIPFRRLALHELRAGMAANFVNVRSRMASFINSLRTRRPSTSVGQKCSMDRNDHLAVDLRGNVLTCQNTSAVSIAPNGQPHAIGHVSQLAEATPRTATHWTDRPDCAACPVLQICQGACMYLQGDLWKTTCDNAYAEAVPIFAASIEFLTGYVPYFIEGDFREDRKDIFGEVHGAPKAKPKRVIPINAIA